MNTDKKSAGGAKLRVTPSKLGAFTVPNACEACLFRLIRVNFKKPFDFGTPAIMQDLDYIEKQVAIVSLGPSDELPEYFGTFREAVEVWPIQSLSAEDPVTGLPLYGKPDLVFKDENGRVLILDNKTCQPKAEGSDLLAKYSTQVNLYGYCVENQSIAYNVSRLGLLHYTVEKPNNHKLEDMIFSTGITVELKAALREIPFDPDVYVIPYLKKFKTLLEADSCPKGNKDCSDCKLISQWNSWKQQRDATPSPMLLTRDERAKQDAAIRMAAAMQCDSANVWKDQLLRLANPLGALAAWYEGGDE